MKIFFIGIQIIFLYFIYFLGIYIQVLLHLPIPGSLLGMMLLFGLLSTNIVKIKWVDQGANILIRYLPLLFLPVVVGIIQHMQLFSGRGIFLLVIVALSTIFVMACSGLVSHWMWKRMEDTHD